MPRVKTDAEPIRFLNRFTVDENGGLTIFGIFIFMAMAMLAGIAVDYSNLITAKTQLQVTSDIVAHAALYNRDTKSRDDAKTAALSLINASMPGSRYGIVITEQDIVFGKYDYDTEIFTLDENSKSAVLVTTSRLRTKSNAVMSYLLQLVGSKDWEVSVQSVAVTFRPTCFREGFVANGIVDIQSNNSFMNGFCIHSNTNVSLNNNNTFESGTVVSMPDTGTIDLPGSGWELNEGLQAALRDGAYRLRIVNKLASTISSLTSYSSSLRPSYITSPTIEYRSLSKYTPADFVQGRIHILNCTSASIEANAVIQNVVIVANCPIALGNNVVLENAVLATTDTSSKSVKSPQGLRLGKNDNCAKGGGAQILSLGSMDFAAALEMYGSQLIADQNIAFTANANGIQGASIIAGGTIDGTSNMEMGFCGTGMENNFEAEYFRLAR